MCQAFLHDMKRMKNIRPLSYIIETPENHKAFVDNVVKRVELHIQGLGAIKGMFVRKTYDALKAVRPGYIHHIIEVLSRDYIQEFSGMHEDYRASQNLPAENIQSESDYILAHQEEAEKHFWIVAEKYAAKRKDSMIGKLYQTGKTTIKKHIKTVFKVIFDEIAEFTVYDV